MRHSTRAPRAALAADLAAHALLFGALGGCADPNPEDSAAASKPHPLDTPADVGDACATERIETVSIAVQIDGQAGPCPFGVEDNAPPTDAKISGRIEQRFELSLPADAVVCDLDFVYGGVGDEDGVPMRYDDQFFFTFGGALLAASDAALVAALPKQGVLPIYDWPAVRGAELNFFDAAVGWCLGETEGLSTCEIPTAEVEGALKLDFSQAVINELSYRAIVEDRLDFGFVTMGDNDSTDCSHDPFGFTIAVPFFRRR